MKKDDAIKFKSAELTAEIIKEFYRESNLRRDNDSGKIIAQNFEDVYNKILDLLNKD